LCVLYCFLSLLVIFVYVHCQHNASTLISTSQVLKHSIEHLIADASGISNRILETCYVPKNNLIRDLHQPVCNRSWPFFCICWPETRHESGRMLQCIVNYFDFESDLRSVLSPTVFTMKFHTTKPQSTLNFFYYIQIKCILRYKKNSL
jgi:hypothetical protein